MAISEKEQSAYDELRQELELNCCEVVLKKRNAELILAIIDIAGEAVLLHSGDALGSLDSHMDVLQLLLGKAVGVEIPTTVPEG